MSLFDKFNQWKSRKKYERFEKIVSRLPEQEQKKIAKDIYSQLWNAIKEQGSDSGKGAFGGTGVMFECPYPGHVQYHARRKLDAEVADVKSPIKAYSLEGDSKKDWILTVVAEGADGETARLKADACAMSAILEIPTSKGSYDRLQFSVEPGENGDIQADVDKAMEIIPNILRGKYEMIPSASGSGRYDVVQYEER